MSGSVAVKDEKNKKKAGKPSYEPYAESNHPVDPAWAAKYPSKKGSGSAAPIDQKGKKAKKSSVGGVFEFLMMTMALIIGIVG
jgi:hypothetical protein